MEFKEIDSVEHLRAFLLERGKGHHNYRHYSTLDGIYGMLKSGYLWLSRGDQMNDRQELTKGDSREWEKIYIASFAFGKSENVAMWGIYGLPHNEAACISFPSYKFSKWIPGISAVFDPKKNYQKIECEFEIQLTDVVYIGGFRGAKDQVLKWNDNKLQVNDLANIDDFEYISGESQMTGFIKNYAWSYENEVRIRIKVNTPINNERIAIKIPEYFFEGLENEEKVRITYGPWDKSARKEKKTVKFEDALRSDICIGFRYDQIEKKSSDFMNLVMLNETCKCCQLFTDNNDKIKRKAPSLFQDV